MEKQQCKGIGNARLKMYVCVDAAQHEALCSLTEVHLGEPKKRGRLATYLNKHLEVLRTGFDYTNRREWLRAR